MYLTTSQHDIQICEFWTFFCPWTLEVCSSIAVTDRDFFQQAGQAASGCISWDVREVGIWWSWWNMFGNQMCVFLWCGKMINLEKVLNLLHAPFAHIGCEDLWSTSPTMRLRLFVKNSRQRFLKQHLQWKLPNKNGNCLTFDREILYMFQILKFWNPWVKFPGSKRQTVKALCFTCEVTVMGLEGSDDLHKCYLRLGCWGAGHGHYVS